MEQRRYTVGVLGVPDVELRVIKSICAITSSRAQSYLAVEPDRAEIQLVNADDATAVKLLSAIDPDSKKPTVYLTADGRQIGSHSLKRPFMPAALLKLLDFITTQEMPCAPAAPASGGARVMPPEVRLAFRALVVDDSQTVRKQLELALTELGGAVNTAHTGEQALAALENDMYDMVFLDVVLPGADGYQICKTIKRNRQRKGLPVVMLTSKSSPFDKVRGSLAGCDTYLTKPAEFETLRRVVEKYSPDKIGSELPGVSFQV